MSDEEKLEKWLNEHDGDDYCMYCIYNDECNGLASGPDGPIYPPCVDWDNDDYIENLDTDSILEDLKDEAD